MSKDVKMDEYLRDCLEVNWFARKAILSFKPTHTFVHDVQANTIDLSQKTLAGNLQAFFFVGGEYFAASPTDSTFQVRNVTEWVELPNGKGDGHMALKVVSHEKEMVMVTVRYIEDDDLVMELSVMPKEGEKPNSKAVTAQRRFLRF